jgi:hypothetical protein
MKACNNLKFGLYLNNYWINVEIFNIKTVFDNEITVLYYARFLQSFFVRNNGHEAVKWMFVRE